MKSVTYPEHILGKKLNPGWGYYWVKGDPNEFGEYSLITDHFAKQLYVKFNNEEFLRCNCLALCGLIRFKRGKSPKDLLDYTFKVILYRDDIIIESGVREIPLYLIEIID